MRFESAAIRVRSTHFTIHVWLELFHVENLKMEFSFVSSRGLSSLPTFMTFSNSRVWFGDFKISLPIAVSSFGDPPAPFTKMLLFEYLLARMLPLSSIFSLIPCLTNRIEFDLLIGFEAERLRSFKTSTKARNIRKMRRPQLFLQSLFFY